MALLVCSFDGLVKQLLDLFHVFLADTALIFVVVMLAVDQCFHRLAFLFFHELGDDIIFMWAVNKGGSDINFNSCELVGVDPSSIPVSAFEYDVRASPGSEGSGGSDAGHSCADDDKFMNLFHATKLFKVKLRYVNLKYKQVKSLKTKLLYLDNDYDLRLILPRFLNCSNHETGIKLNETTVNI